MLPTPMPNTSTPSLCSASVTVLAGEPSFCRPSVMIMAILPLVWLRPLSRILLAREKPEYVFVPPRI